MRIGQISPLNLPIPPGKYGGAEKIIFQLCQGLTKAGHDVFLFGTKNSRVKCHLVPILNKGLWQIKPKEHIPYYAYQMAVIAKMAKTLRLDILHDHLGPISLSLYGQVKVPIVHTLHVPFKNKDRPWAYRKLNAKLVSISLAQRKPFPGLNYAANIYNGIDLDFFSFGPKAKDYFLWVGELSPRKGIYEVIKIAKMTGIKLFLIGRIPPPEQFNDHIFFKKYIEGQLNKGKIKYLGELPERGLKRFYKGAIAFLYPLQWEEPFGLTMAEAQACGTPVVAFKRGSVPEVVRDGKTGFVVDPLDKKGRTNYRGFIQAMERVRKISRRDCRRWVEENFTKEIMVENYERLYYNLLKNR